MAEGRGEAGARQIAADMMDQTVRRTAQPVSMADRSIMEANPNMFLKWMMMFKSEARQKFAISQLALKHILKGQDIAMNTQRIAVGWLLMGFVNQMMGDVFKFIAYGDDEIEVADYIRSMLLGQFSGLPILGDVIVTGITGATGGKVFQNSQSPMGDVVRSLQRKAANPSNWRNEDDALKGIGILAKAGAMFTGSILAANVAMGFNAWKFASGAAQRIGLIEPEKRKK